MNISPHSVGGWIFTGLAVWLLIGGSEAAGEEPGRINPLRLGRSDAEVQPAQFLGSPPVSRGQVLRQPRHLSSGAQRVIQQPEMEPLPGLMLHEPMPGELPLEALPMAGDCCDAGGPCTESCCLVPCPTFGRGHLQVFGGVHGFTGPANRGQTGSFGFHQGFNWGAPLPCWSDQVGMQLGLQTTHSNFSGAEFTTQSRNQVFLTSGFFRRVDWGLQGGLVVDYMHDNWYYKTDLVQLRGEISWVSPSTHEFGFWFSAGVREQTRQSVLRTVRGDLETIEETWGVTDLYAFFYRHRFDDCGAEGRLFAGFTGRNDGLLGADILLPINDNWAVESGFTYLVPSEPTGAGGHVEEAWNVAVNLVWFPGFGRRKDYYRPLLNVADNGSFIVNRTTP